jgi:hypothetical protein
MSQSKSQNYDLGLAFWTMAFYYLALVQAAASETIKQGNQWVVWSDGLLDEEEYENQTKWSDFNIIVPLLFNFYHGLELLLKGFVVLKAKAPLKLNHDIEALLTEFTQKYPDQHCLIHIFKKYIGKDVLAELLKQFFAENNCSTNKLYEVLRYPADIKLIRTFIHTCLKYQGEASIPFFEELQSDIDCIRRCSVKLGRSLG